MACSRMLFCAVGFKQNIGHCGKDIVVCGVHGHYRTMKFEWPAALRQFWDQLARKLCDHDVKFLAGDFSMALTQVAPQLSSRGLMVIAEPNTPSYTERHSSTSNTWISIHAESSTSEAVYRHPRLGACVVGAH